MTSSFTYLYPYLTDETAPVVSVIMPAYNTAKYIGRAIDSVLQQSLSKIEVIVVDDASSDNTTEVVKKISDNRVRLFILSENQGAAAARNRALQEARGQWVAVLDSDDWYAPKRLESLLEIAQQTHADMVADDIWFIEDGSAKPWATLVQESGQLVEPKWTVTTLDYLNNDRHGQKGLHLGLSKPLINRKFLIKHSISYKPEVRLGQDFFLYLECLIRGAKFVFEPTPYYFYRARAGSLFTKSQVDRLTQACHATKNWLLQEEVISNQPLKQALSKTLRAYRQSLSYYSVVEPLKQRPLNLGIVLSALVQNPYFFARFTQRIPQIFGKRLGQLLDYREASSGRRTT